MRSAALAAAAAVLEDLELALGEQELPAGEVGEDLDAPGAGIVTAHRPRGRELHGLRGGESGGFGDQLTAGARPSDGEGERLAHAVAAEVQVHGLVAFAAADFEAGPVLEATFGLRSEDGRDRDMLRVLRNRARVGGEDRYRPCVRS